MDCGAVDDDAPVIRGVKLLGEESRNNRVYLPESVSPSQYEGRVINLNHPDGPNKQRNVQDRFGWIESAKKDGKDWRGDIHYNPAHPFAPTFKWIAKNKPDLIGLSHDAVGTGHTKDGKFIVEKVVEVKSVDLVADPATTKGLFESMNPELETPAAGEDESSIAQHIGELIVKIWKDESADPKEKRKQVLKALKLLGDGEETEETEESEEEGSEKAEDEAEGGGNAEEEEEEKKTEESLQVLAKKYPGVKSLMERVDRLDAEANHRKKLDLAHQLCESAKLPSVLITDVFMGQLLEAKDEKAMKALIEDRRAISTIKRPTSTGPAGGSSTNLDNKSFAKQLTGAR